MKLTGLLIAAGLVGGGAGGIGWVVTDRLEQDDDFCNACHLETGPTGVVPLHIDIRRDFDRAEPLTLAAVHGGARLDERPDDPDFRCIDCHGGASLLGRARVKALAARDALVYVFGRVEEPGEMRFPLWDEDCSQCHAQFAPPARAAGTGGTPAFHELAVHNTEMPVACVECHFAHERGGNADAYFLHPAPVRRQCARCHAEFEE